MRWLAGILVTVCVGMLPEFAPGAAAAGVAGRDSIPRGLPELAKHRFVPSDMVPLPFVRTFLRNDILLGSSGNLETPPLEIAGTPIAGLKGSIVAASLDFEYQLALKRWLALRAQVGLSAQTGTEVNTLLAEGVQTALDFQVGWLVALLGGNRTQLSCAASISNRSVTGLSVLNLVRDLVEGTDAGLTRKTPVLNGTFGLRGAWAVSNLFGLNAVADLGSGETADRTRSTQMFHRVGLAATFDLDEYGLPFGVTLSGLSTDFGGATVTRRDNSSAAGLKLSYIGRDAFLLSFGISTARVPTDGMIEDITVTSTGVSLQYFF